MVPFFRRHLGFCEHNWVEVDRGNLLKVVSRQKVGLYFTYRCSKCKELKETRSNG